MRRRILVKLIVILILTATYWLSTSLSFTSAQGADYDAINRIARQMNCPTCVGVNLADCRTQTCSQWREQIGDMIQEGRSDQEILDFFATQYGDRVLLEPPKHGSTLLLWVLPVVALLAGGGWLVYMMRRWNTAEVAPTTPMPVMSSNSPTNDASEDYLRQVEKDLEG